jgi:hypothetical protein
MYAILYPTKLIMYIIQSPPTEVYPVLVQFKLIQQ